jgi:hypothetical protein
MLHMMNTKILHIKVILFVVLQCMFLSAVNSDVTCEAGEYPPYGFTSGPASQCSGLSKITTEAECKAAAEYNRKNNIDQNVGLYGGRLSDSDFPPGCFYWSYYYFNDYPTSTKKCSINYKCICKTKTCINCPSGTCK